MHLITLQNYSTDQIESIIDLSIKIKKDFAKYENLLKYKSLYMLFEKTSTRTSLSFGLGFNELGGNYFMQRWQDSNFVIGEVEDEVRYVARNVDIILARLKLNKDIECMGKFSPIPVINGCCDKFHPTQALADCMTVKEIFGTYKKTLLYIGIWNNVFNSLVASFPRLGGKLIGICPIINNATLSEKEAESIAEKTDQFELYGADISQNKLNELVENADVIYTDTWIDMEFFTNPAFAKLKEDRIKLMKPFSLTAKLLANSQAVIMHDMPIHPGYEIDRDVVEKHLKTILDQGENRRHVAKGIFAYLLNMEI